MPTAHPRHHITETPDVAHALDLAAALWPGEPRSKLLLRLVRAGSEALESREQDRLAVRRAAVLATAGKYANAFHAGFLSELREDWPG